MEQLQSIKDNLPTDQQALLDALFSKSVTAQKNAAKMRTSAANKRKSRKQQAEELVAYLKSTGQWEALQEAARAKAEADLAASGFTVTPAKYRRGSKANGAGPVPTEADLIPA